ncbi:Uma2 family endonuclease [Nocardia alni]|uniref:Uma2 family endonuclease n=1 Tax=Nocardia alni TaxID=2815723 RepID=UPI0027E05533|nr:Uma2 family endonuclease [Nocardia alni]
MTALPDERPDEAPETHLLTVADYIALPEDDLTHWELQEGILVMSPSPTPEHNLAFSELHFQLRAQLPSELISIPADVDLDLQLDGPDEPATIRRPDIVVVTRTEFDRRRSEGGILRASGAVLVVEFVSPGTRRRDRTIKRYEYADAGIPNYWIVDLTSPVSLLPYRLTEELGYVDDGETTAKYTTDAPCSLTIDLSLF